MLKILNLKIVGQSDGDVILTTNRRFKYFKANEDLFNLKEGLLFRKYYKENSSVKYCQNLITKQLVNEELLKIHEESEKQPGITKTKIWYREKHHYQKMTQLFRKWVMSCEQCLRESQNVRRFTRPPMQNPNVSITAPQDAMQFDLMPGLPPSGVYENIVTTVDMFSR